MSPQKIEEILNSEHDISRASFVRFRSFSELHVGILPSKNLLFSYFHFSTNSTQLFTAKKYVVDKSQTCSAVGHIEFLNYLAS